jgi:hypothetical protein
MTLTQRSLRRRLCRLTLPTPEALALQRPLLVHFNFFLRRLCCRIVGPVKHNASVG